MSPRETRDSVVGVRLVTEDRARDMGASNGTSPASTVFAEESSPRTYPACHRRAPIVKRFAVVRREFP